MLSSRQLWCLIYKIGEKMTHPNYGFLMGNLAKGKQIPPHLTACPKPVGLGAWVRPPPGNSTILVTKFLESGTLQDGFFFLQTNEGLQIPPLGRPVTSLPFGGLVPGRPLGGFAV